MHGEHSKHAHDSLPPAGGRVKRLFESPYRIDSPEAPADLSHVGNGRGHLIDAEIEDLIEGVSEDAEAVHEEFEELEG